MQNGNLCSKMMKFLKKHSQPEISSPNLRIKVSTSPQIMVKRDSGSEMREPFGQEIICYHTFSH